MRVAYLRLVVQENINFSYTILKLKLLIFLISVLFLLILLSLVVSKGLLPDIAIKNTNTLIYLIPYVVANNLLK